MSEPDESEKRSQWVWLVWVLLAFPFIPGDISWRGLVKFLPVFLFWVAVPALLLWLMWRFAPLGDRPESASQDYAVTCSAIKTAPLHQVDVLVQWVKHTDRTLHELAAARLIELVGAASAEQIEGLMLEQREVLYGCINLGNALEHPQLVDALLTLVERVHDPHALPVVRGLAEARSYLPNTDGAIARAKAVQELLEAAIGQTVSKAVLLRPTGGDDALLRPAGNGSAPLETNLLRPSPADE
jgi:hypothetical protein